MNAARRIVRHLRVQRGARWCGGFMMAGAAGILPPAFGSSSASSTSWCP
ncbi:MAG: hypothetical protein ACLTMP_05540 [Eggerthella lenta]